jgi:hypothetical protein
MTETKTAGDAEDDILRFLATTVLGTNSRSDVHGGGPICTENELRFLVRALKASIEHRKLSTAEIDRLHALFIRAGESRHIDLRDGAVLCERLKASSSPFADGEPS